MAYPKGGSRQPETPAATFSGRWLFSKRAASNSHQPWLWPDAPRLWLGIWLGKSFIRDPANPRLITFSGDFLSDSILGALLPSWRYGGRSVVEHVPLNFFRVRIGCGVFNPICVHAGIFHAASGSIPYNHASSVPAWHD